MSDGIDARTAAATKLRSLAKNCTAPHGPLREYTHSNREDSYQIKHYQIVLI
jgi:hypothetical protein